MNYYTFVRLRNDEQAYHTLTNGIYLGTNEDGDDIYQLYDFWVSVQENTKGFYYEAKTTQPNYMASEIIGAQEL
jgi:hypothetical protein